MTDLSANLDHFDTVELAVTRADPGVLAENGLYENATSTELVVRACVVPIAGRQLELLPEAWRTREAIQVFSKDELRPVDEEAKTDGDRFTFNGRRYEVQQVSNWSAQGGYWSAVAIKVTTS